MQIFTRKPHCLLKFAQISHYIASKGYKHELNVPTFCDVQVHLPFNVVIRPLDVHKYHNCDKLKIKLIGGAENEQLINYSQSGNTIKIFSKEEEYDNGLTCSIKVPIKANLHVVAKGSITAGGFNGSQLMLKSINSNIVVDKYQGNEIDLTTENGGITLNGTVVASKIRATVLENGSITTKRLQGLSTELKTKKGSIAVESSYCDQGRFSTESGDLSLSNIHKNTKIDIKRGNLTLTGLDGTLEASIENGNGDVQVAQILGDSRIDVKNGDLTLRLSEECQERNAIKIIAEKFSTDERIKSLITKNGDTLYLKPLTEDCRHLFVSCNGFVQVQSASWADMLQLKFNK